MWSGSKRLLWIALASSLLSASVTGCGKTGSVVFDAAGLAADIAAAAFAKQTAEKPLRLECPGWAGKFEPTDQDIAVMSEGLVDQLLVYQCSREHYCLDIHRDHCKELLH